jgi:hypothetical protein
MSCCGANQKSCRRPYLVLAALADFLVFWPQLTSALGFPTQRTRDHALWSIAIDRYCVLALCAAHHRLDQHKICLHDFEERRRGTLRAFAKEDWLRGLDLNQRPSGYEPDELPGCSTPRLNYVGTDHEIKLKDDPAPHRLRDRLKLAPAVGFEPTTNRLTADRSTTELRWITQLKNRECIFSRTIGLRQLPIS